LLSRDLIVLYKPADYGIGKIPLLAFGTSHFVGYNEAPRSLLQGILAKANKK